MQNKAPEPTSPTRSEPASLDLRGFEVLPADETGIVIGTSNPVTRRSRPPRGGLSEIRSDVLIWSLAPAIF